MGQPDEIAALVSYLAGPEAGYMTGASLTIEAAMFSSSLSDLRLAGRIANSTTARALLDGPRPGVAVEVGGDMPRRHTVDAKVPCTALRPNSFP